MAPLDLRTTIETVWRMESAKVIAGVARIVRDVGLAEDFAQDALVAALEQWPVEGLPEKPGAWLMGTAKHRALDHLRRARRVLQKQDDVARTFTARGETDEAALREDLDVDLDDDVGDAVLRLVFTCCHPVLSNEARVALTLRLLGGLTTDEIARAYLVAEPTVAQRIVRAKRTLAEQGVPFEVPRGSELGPRLDSVLEAVYLIFNEGYAATSGGEWTRPTLCAEALRLARVLAALAPREPEVQGLLALLELQASRLAARAGRDGAPVLLLDQDRSRWDRLLIRRGLAALARAEALGGADGPYALQAAIAACHARARTGDETDWRRIAGLYGRLERVQPSPVVALNRAVAVAYAEGPAAGLALTESLLAEPALARYHLLPSVRGELLRRLGRFAEARAECERAAALTRNEQERRLLLDRAAECAREAGG